MPVINPTSISWPFLHDQKNFDGRIKRLTLEGPLTLYRFGGGSTGKPATRDSAADGPGDALKYSKIDRGGARKGPTQYGSYWCDATLLAELKGAWLDEAYNGTQESRRNILAGFRDGLAVAKNWSNFSSFCRLRLLKGDSLITFYGRTSPKPEWTKPASDAPLRDDTPLFSGGAEQYLVYDLHVSAHQDRIDVAPMSSLWMHIDKIDRLWRT